MPSLAASSSELSVGRVWPQHQALLTLIKDRVENPNRRSFKWLDLACGRGQILTNIGHVLSPENCSKIEYRGFDVVQGYCLQAERIAKEFFPNAQIQVCEIDKFELHLEPEESFDAITLTNTVHEITPEQVAAIFVSTLCRVNDDGIVFMYDMESLPALELGAIPWLGKEVEQVVHRLLLEAGENTYRPTVATWPHKTCIGWNIQLNRSHLTVTPDAVQSRRAEMIKGASGLIRDLLGKRLLDINQALSSVSRYAEGDGAEQSDVQRLAYDFWAISRALGLPLRVSMGAT
jgi:ubiquinone/menaquinone biosynthesis C-methylase UbiE